MRNAYFNWIVFCALALVLGCRTSSPDWNGAWRFNPSRSTFRGPVFTISLSTDGEYHYYDRAVGAAGVAFRCDGKYRPMGKNVTEACVKKSDTVLDMIRKENGVKTTASRWELSADGKALTLTATGFRPSGSYIKGQVVASRISGSNGFAGQWEDESYNKPFADMTLRFDGQRLHITYPNAGQYIDAPLTGADSAMLGRWPTQADIVLRY